MHPLRPPVLTLIILLLTCFNASAESLTEIYKQALQNDPQLQADRAVFKAGQESENIARAPLLPSLTAIGEYTDSDYDSTTHISPSFRQHGNTDADTENYMLTLQQKIFDLSAWFTFQQGVELSRQSAATFSAAQQSMILRVTSAYFDVLRAEANLNTAVAEERAIQRQLEQTNERFEVGLLPITDVHEAQARFDDARVNSLVARGQLGIAFEALTVLTGKNYEKLDGLVDNFPVTPPIPASREEWVEFALKHNFSVKAAAYAKEAADQNAKAKKSGHLPTVTGNLSYYDNHADSHFDGSPMDEHLGTDQDGHTASIRLTIPLATGGLISAERRKAAQQYIQAKENHLAAQRNTVQQTRSEHLNVVTDSARVKARLQAITSAKSAMEATQAGYEVGTRNIVDVLLVQQNLYQAMRNYHNARYDYIASLLKLKQVSGQLSPDDVYQLNAWLDPAIQVLKADAREELKPYPARPGSVQQPLSLPRP